MRPIAIVGFALVAFALVGLAGPAGAVPVEVSWFVSAVINEEDDVRGYAIGELGVFEVLTGTEQFSLPTSDPGFTAFIWSSESYSDTLPLVNNTGVSLRFSSITSAKLVDASSAGDARLYFGLPSDTIKLQIDPGTVDIAYAFSGDNTVPFTSGQLRYSAHVSYTVTIVPEPASALLLGAGLVALGQRARRRPLRR